MNIRTAEDNTGFAPPDYRWHAWDDDTYDGPTCQMGFGTTEQDAISDLVDKTDG